VFCGRGDGGTPPELCSAAGEVAGVGVPGATGLGLGRGLAEGGVRCVRNAPGVTAGLGEALLGLATARGRGCVAGVPCAGT